MRLYSVALSLVLAATAIPARAADHRKIEDRLPVRVEDAYPASFRSFEAQPHVRYERSPDGRDVFVANAKVEWGALRNAEIALEVPLELTLGETLRVDAVGVSALYNVNVETVALPALSVGAGIGLPTSLRSDDLDASLEGLLTKGWGGYRFHLNYAHTFVGDSGGDTRSNRWFLGVGLDRLLTVDVVLVATAWTEQSEEAGDPNLNALEAGVRWMVRPGRLIAVGAGAGFGGPGDGAFVITTMGVQQVF